MAWVYILRCGDNTFYVGHTADLDSRIEWHQRGLASNHTSARLPVDLVYAEEYSSRADARARERQLKRWSAQKLALIAGDLKRLHSLAKRKRPKSKR